MTVAAALAALAVFAPTPSPAPTLLEQPCPQTLAGALACAQPDLNVVYIDPALRAEGRFYFLEAIGHELGHIWAAQHPVALERFAAMVNASPVARVPIGERFADTYAFCAVGPRMRARFKREVGEYDGTYGERISHRVLSNTCWLLRHAPTIPGR